MSDALLNDLASDADGADELSVGVDFAILSPRRSAEPTAKAGLTGTKSAAQTGQCGVDMVLMDNPQSRCYNPRSRSLTALIDCVL